MERSNLAPLESSILNSVTASVQDALAASIKDTLSKAVAQAVSTERVLFGAQLQQLQQELHKLGATNATAERDGGPSATPLEVRRPPWPLRTRLWSRAAGA